MFDRRLVGSVARRRPESGSVRQRAREGSSVRLLVGLDTGTGSIGRRRGSRALARRARDAARPVPVRPSVRGTAPRPTRQVSRRAVLLPACTAIAGIVFGGVLVGMTGSHAEHPPLASTASQQITLPPGPEPASTFTTTVPAAPITVVVTRTASPTPLAQLGDGTYRVPAQAAAGLWSTNGISEITGSLLGCYWARLKSLSGDPTSIIASDNLAAGAATTIAVEPGDAALKLSGGCRWSRIR